MKRGAETQATSPCLGIGRVGPKLGCPRGLAVVVVVSTPSAIPISPPCTPLLPCTDATLDGQFPWSQVNHPYTGCTKIWGYTNISCGPGIPQGWLPGAIKNRARIGHGRQKTETVKVAWCKEMLSPYGATRPRYSDPGRHYTRHRKKPRPTPAHSLAASRRLRYKT